MSKITIVEGNSNDKDNVRVLMVKGERGYSAYDLYVQNGGTLTEEEWLDAFLNAENYYTKGEVKGLVINNLDSELTDQPLSAKQGKELNKAKATIYDTVALMKADTSLKVGMTVQTLGYYSVNDGGGCEYRIVSTEPSSMLGVIELDNDLYAVLNSNYVTPKMFGATDTENVDQSSFIQNCLNYCFDNNIEEVSLDGEYFVNTTISFQNKSNLKIKNGTLYVHEVNDVSNYNVLSFINCDNIIIDNIRVIEINPAERTYTLYVGGLYFEGSDDCLVSNCYLENTMAGIIFKNLCHRCIAENNTILNNYHLNHFTSSAIILYSSIECVIRNNNITGEYYDGTLSIYGASCQNNIVDGNIIKNISDDNFIYLSEGITIDGGAKRTTITNNYVYDEYYGIDNKNDSMDTLISNNTLIGNKISIADRPGEENKSTINCKIHGNEIIFRVDWDTSTIGTTLFDGFYYIGCMINEKNSADIKDNRISVFGNMNSLPVCAIKCSKGTTQSNVYVSQFDIIGNTIEFATGHGATTGNAGAGSVGIKLVDVKKGLITNNSLKVDTGASRYDMIVLAGAIENLLITSNLCYMTSRTNHYFINKDSSATITKCEISNNKIKDANQPNLENITNIVEKERFNIKAHQAPTLSLTANTWVTAVTMHVQYADAISLSVLAMAQSGGNRYIYGTYNINVSGTTVTPNSINESVNGLEIQFVNDDNNNNVALQVKAPRNMTLENLYIYDVCSGQALTLS